MQFDEIDLSIGVRAGDRGINPSLVNLGLGVPSPRTSLASTLRASGCGPLG